MCRIMMQSIKLLLAEANAIATLPVEMDPKKWQKTTANMSPRHICWKHGQKVLIQLSRKLTKKHLLASADRWLGEFWSRREIVDAWWELEEGPSLRGLWSPSRKQSCPRCPRSRCAGSGACSPSGAQGWKHAWKSGFVTLWSSYITILEYDQNLQKSHVSHQPKVQE